MFNETTHAKTYKYNNPLKKELIKKEIKVRFNYPRAVHKVCCFFIARFTRFPHIVMNVSLDDFTVAKTNKETTKSIFQISILGTNSYSYKLDTA